MSEQKSPIRALGEIALRVNDLDATQRFYEEVIGLRLLKRFPHAAFFALGKSYGGHTQVLALFDRQQENPGLRVSSATSTIDHFAFAIDRADYQREYERLAGLGLTIETAEHAWVHWRSIYVSDPEGNLVELVCYDPDVV